MVTIEQWMDQVENSFFSEDACDEIENHISDRTKEELLIDVLKTGGHVKGKDDSFRSCRGSLMSKRGLEAWLQKESTQYLLDIMKTVVTAYADEENFEELLNAACSVFIKDCPFIRSMPKSLQGPKWPADYTDKGSSLRKEKEEELSVYLQQCGCRGTGTFITVRTAVNRVGVQLERYLWRVTEASEIQEILDTVELLPQYRFGLGWYCRFLSKGDLMSKKTTSDADDRLTRTEVFDMCREQGYYLTSPFNVAKRNATTDEYWCNPNFSVLRNDWTLILNDQHDKVLRIFEIPADTFDVDGFYLREREGLVNLRIDSQTYVDKGPRKYNFAPYFVKEISY